jgi:hypothetical protein
MRVWVLPKLIPFRHHFPPNAVHAVLRPGLAFRFLQHHGTGPVEMGHFQPRHCRKITHMHRQLEKLSFRWCGRDPYTNI